MMYACVLWLRCARCGAGAAGQFSPGGTVACANCPAGAVILRVWYHINIIVISIIMKSSSLYVFCLGAVWT